MADVKPFLYILCIAWCYCQDTVADLIAIVVADVIATRMWWIFLPLSLLCNDSITLDDVIANLYCGRTYCHLFCG